ncbi:unnamed protein product, partial [Symbiodinium necroappetens]
QSALRLPWEKGIYAEIFSGSELPKMPSLPVPAVLPAGDVTRPGDSREKVLKHSSDPLQKFDRAVFKQCIKKSSVAAGGRSNTDREAVYRRKEHEYIAQEGSFRGQNAYLGTVLEFSYFRFTAGREFLISGLRDHSWGLQFLDVAKQVGLDLRGGLLLRALGDSFKARPLRELQECIGLIKRQVFHPDSTRSGMFRSVEQSEQVASGSDALEDAAKQFIAAVPAETPMELGTLGEDERKQSDLDAFEGCDDGGELQAASSESGSSTTSSSGSSDEAVDAYESFSEGRVLDKVIPPLGVEVDLDVFQNPKTRSLHTRAKGSQGPLMCGRKTEGMNLFSGKVFSKHWICKQCEQARPLRDRKHQRDVLQILFSITGESWDQGHCVDPRGEGYGPASSLADMAVPLTESKAVFTEHCELAGLPGATRDVLVCKNLNTLASLAFAAGQPGETPTDAALTSLARAGDEEVPIATLASLRRLVFEAQLLMTAQVKQLIEQRSDDQKAELASAERTERIKTTSRAELRLDKPKKELDVVNSKITLKDQVVDLQCQLSTPLCLHHSLHRRALAMDLVGICSYHVIMEFHEYLMSHLTVEPPPGYNHVTIHQVLSADRAAWLRLAEKLPKGLRAGTDGKLPLDLELPLLQGDKWSRTKRGVPICWAFNTEDLQVFLDRAKARVAGVSIESLFGVE